MGDIRVQQFARNNTAEIKCETAVNNFLGEICLIIGGRLSGKKYVIKLTLKIRRRKGQY